MGRIDARQALRLATLRPAQSELYSIDATASTELTRLPAGPLGFALGWLGWEGGVHFHSHQVGVRSGGRGTGVGAALKLAQRALCLEQGITEMRWTFDPLLFAKEFGMAAWHGVSAWLLIAPFAALLIKMLILPVLRQLAASLQRQKEVGP